MKKYVFFLLLVFITTSACNNGSKKQDSNSIQSIQNVLQTFYYPNVPHISLSPDESIIDIYRKMCATQDVCFQNFYLICDSCEYQLPIDVFSLRCIGRISDILPMAQIVIKTDSTFTWESDYVEFEDRVYNLNELTSIVNHIMDENIELSEILFVIMGDENTKMKEIVNIASYIQTLYWKWLFYIELEYGILKTEKSRELHLWMNNLLMTIVVYSEDSYYECDCDERTLKQYEVGDRGFFMYF
ncbi:MAG: hypothetical protein JXR53_02725 [Bacteroidales bacterium]|nr:hypothetical protein [Bacteroidales bacterium]